MTNNVWGRVELPTWNLLTMFELVQVCSSPTCYPQPRWGLTNISITPAVSLPAWWSWKSWLAVHDINDIPCSLRWLRWRIFVWLWFHLRCTPATPGSQNQIIPIGPDSVTWNIGTTYGGLRWTTECHSGFLWTGQTSWIMPWRPCDRLRPEGYSTKVKHSEHWGT